MLIDNDFNFVQNTGVFTIEFWMRADDLTNDAAIMSSASATADNGFMIALNNAGAGSLRFASFRGVGGQYVYDGNTGTGFIVDNNWHHVAIVSDGTDVTLYLDGDGGIGLGGAFGTLATGPATNTIALGGYAAFSGSSFNGDLDEVRIWNTAVSAGDIAVFANTTDISSHPNYSDMVAYYKFDDGAGSPALEDVFANNDGVLTNMDALTDWVASGALADAPEQNALNFDGTNDYVEIADDPILDITTEITVSAWLRLEGSTGLVQNAVRKNDNYVLGWIPSNYSGFEAQVFVGGQWETVVSSFTATELQNEWHHFAMTYDGNNLRLFIDGVLDNEVPLSGTMNTTTDPLHLGSVSFAAQEFFRGSMDEVRVWNIALTDQDIRDYLYSSDLSSHPALGNLAAHYDFNQGTDSGNNTGETTLSDQSGNALDGTLNGFTLNGATSNFIASGTNDHTPTESSTQASNLIPFGVTENSVDLTWTNGDGQRRVVAVFEGMETEMPIPSDNQFFHADSNFGGGDILDGSWYTVYNGYGNSVTVEGLSAGSEYSVAVLEVNGPPTFEAYNSNAEADNPVSFTTNASINNYALEFEPSSEFVSIPDDPVFDMDGDWTIEAWIKTPSTGQESIITQISGTTGYSFFKIGGTLYFQYYSSGGLQNSGTALSVAAGIDDDQWHHIAVSQNVNNGKIYVDGVPVFTSNSMIGIDEPSTPIRLGYDAFVGNLTGVLDEVRFWDYQLTDGEISNSYDSRLNGDETGLIAYYNFEDGTGSLAAADVTGNGNDGALTNMDENTDWVQGPALSEPSGGGSSIFEDFETGTVPSADYSGTLSLGSGDWEGNSLSPESINVFSGLEAVSFNLAGDYLQSFEIAEGVEDVSFFVNQTTGAGGELDILYSTDGGSMFNSAGQTGEFSFTEYEEIIIPIGTTEPTIIRLEAVTTNEPVYLDDITININDGGGGPVGLPRVIYFTTPSATDVYKVEINGGIEESLVASNSGVGDYGIAYSAAGDLVYYIDGSSTGDKIMTVKSSGQDVQELVDLGTSGAGGYGSLALDTLSNVLYAVTPSGLQSYDMADGTPINNYGNILIGSTGSVSDIEIYDGTLFWTQSGSDNGVAVASLSDISGTSQLVVDPSVTGSIPGLAIDPVENRLYWTTGAGEIRSANFDGSDESILIDGLTDLEDLEMDYESRFLMYVSDNGSSTSIQAIDTEATPQGTLLVYFGSMNYIHPYSTYNAGGGGGFDFYEDFGTEPLLPTIPSSGPILLSTGTWDGEGVLESGDIDARGGDGNGIRVEPAGGNYIQTPYLQNVNELQFWYKGDGSGGTFEVQTSSDGGTTFDISHSPDINPTTEYQNYNLTLSDYNGPVRIAYISGSTPLFMDDIGADGQELPIDVTYATVSVPGSDLTSGSTDNLIYAFSITPSQQIQTIGFILTLEDANYDPTDFPADPFKAWINSTNDFSTATEVGTYDFAGAVPDGPTVAANQVAMLFEEVLPAGVPTYVFASVDIDAGATVNNNFTVLAIDPNEEVGIEQKINLSGSLSAGDLFTIQSADAIAPTVVAVTPSLETIVSGDNTLNISIEFDEEMNTGLDPAISFPVEDMTGTLTYNNGSWNDAFNYTAVYDVTDTDQIIPDVDVRVENAEDLTGNVMVQFDQADLFSVDMQNPVVALSPQGISPTGFTARWTVGLDVQTYQVDVSTQSDFSSFVSGFESFETTATSVVVSNLDFATSYYYRVRLVDNSDQTSPNSNVRAVKTAIDAVTLADSLALRQIYDAVAPQGLNWEAERLRNWDGVTLDLSRTRVEVVDINGTSAAGDMPNPFTGDAFANGGLSSMLEMNAANNQITGLMDYSGTTITSLDVSDNALEFDDLIPVAGITTVDYSNQASIQYNESTGVPIKVRYTNDYSLSFNIGGSNNAYSWYRNDTPITTGTDYIVNNSVSVILAIDYDNMGTFRTEVSNPAVPGLIISIDPQIVWAIADMEVSVSDEGGATLTAPFNAYMLETTRTPTGFRVLETQENLTSSTFTFPDVVLGNYITFVESDLSLYIPTYFGDVFEWKEADTLFFRSDDVIEMTMVEVPPELTAADGEGTLEVLIEEDFGDNEGRIDARRRAAKRKCGLRRKRSGGRTGQDDDEFELIAYGETDDNGEFEFGFLPQGTYRFFVEYPGIPLDESSFVEFEVGEAGVSDTDFKLQAFATEDGIEVNIEAVLGIILEYFKDLQIYPNPSSEYLNIRYRHLKSRAVTAQLVDLAGNTMWSADLRNGFDGQIQIDVADYEEGVYILRFYDRESPKENVVSFRVIVKD